MKKKMLTNNLPGAFTLTELLVVMAVMALLAGMLLPALRKARDLARGIGCINNLKNLGQAVHLYVNDTDGWLPMVTPGAVGALGSRENVWMLNDVLMRNIGVNRVYSSGKWTSSNNNRLICPLDKAPYEWTYYDVKTSYAANINMGSGFLSPPYARRMEQFSQPGAVCWGGEIRENHYFNESMVAASTQIPYLHNNGMNILYLDAHVGWVANPMPCYQGGWKPSTADSRIFWRGE
ncbi:MAG: type II secretion system protein [Verrucomicrobiae bacterium]|nr:type II secretion system protein [Verrucomicrobiae bacterium]